MKKKILILILCVSLITCFGCNNVKKEDNSKKIVTSFYPVYIFTKNLTNGIDDVTVTNITQQTGGCLHDYTLLPKDLVLLNDASLFIING
ncbi:MAG: zinc ABC transporter substrate-binding protein, partial [Oscillospiraceae bacterium]